jgi:hypothetical protein
MAVCPTLCALDARWATESRGARSRADAWLKQAKLVLTERNVVLDRTSATFTAITDPAIDGSPYSDALVQSS